MWIDEYLVRIRGYNPDEMEQDEFDFISYLSYRMMDKNQQKRSIFGGGI